MATADTCVEVVLHKEKDLLVAHAALEIAELMQLPELHDGLDNGH